MGEVFRARDMKLNRDVAIEMLPAPFANDPDRLARFTREAQTLAALNHPHIAHIYGLEGQEGRDRQDWKNIAFIVMELRGGAKTSRSASRARRFELTRRCQSGRRSRRHSKRRTSREVSIAI
jgi:serine/threonine protein kinase